MLIGRRALLTGLASLVAAPAVARVAPLMPIKVGRPAPINLPIVGFLVEKISAESMQLRPVHFPWPMYSTRFLTDLLSAPLHFPETQFGESFTIPNAPTDKLIEMGRASLARAKAAGIPLNQFYREIQEFDRAGVPVSTYRTMSPFR